MSENDILVVSDTDQLAKAAFAEFRSTFFDCDWVGAMFTHPVPMFVLENGGEIIFVSRDKVKRYKETWKGQIYPDYMIKQVVGNRYGY